jgi:hypothetical protein
MFLLNRRGNPFRHDRDANQSNCEGRQRTRADSRAQAEALESRFVLSVPSWPGDVYADPVDGFGRSLIHWQGTYAVGGNEVAHMEYSLNNPFNWVEYGTTIAAYHSGYVGGLSTGTRYYFRVRVTSPLGESTNYSELGALDADPTQAPETPRNLVANPVSSGLANLEWEGTYSVNPLDTMFMEYSTNGVNFTVSPTTTYAAYHTGPVSGLSSSGTYYFRVRARTASGIYSGYSNVYRLEPPAVSTNPRVNNQSQDTGFQDTQSETTNLVFGSTVLVAYNDSGSNLVGDGGHFTGWARSTDGGATFTDLGTLPESNFGTNGPGDSGDPVLARNNTTGRVYLSTLGFWDGTQLPVFRSDDGGATFGAPVNGAPGFFGSLDKEWLTVDNFTGTGNGHVYMAFREFGGGDSIYLTRSTDNGNTWGPSGGVQIVDASADPFEGALGPQVVVGRDHSVYVFWLDGIGATYDIKMRRSDNLGVSFGSAVTVATLNSTGFPWADLGLGFRSTGFPSVAVNPANANLVYVAYADKPATGTDRGNVYFKQSTNRGASWSAATKLNDDTGSNDQWQPAITVNPAGTKLFVGFYDRRNDSANTVSDNYGAVARVWGNSVYWKENRRVSTLASAPVYGVDPVVVGTYHGDYDTSSADASYFYYTWGDDRDRSLVRAGKQNNVREAKLAIPYLAVPQAPTNLTASWDSSANPGSATVRWQGTFNLNAPTDVAHIEYSTNGVNFSEISTTIAAYLTGNVYNLNRYQTYYFRVRAENENGFSGYSNIVTLQAGIPATPTGFTATAVDSFGRTTMGWDNWRYQSGDVMRLEYSTTGTSWIESGTTIAMYSYGQISGLTPGGHYYFRIRASNSYGYSQYSNVIFV